MLPSALSPLPIAGLPLAAVDVGELSASNVEAGVFLVIGALGGAHCLGMCGCLLDTSDAADDPFRH